MSLLLNTMGSFEFIQHHLNFTHLTPHQIKNAIPVCESGVFSNLQAICYPLPLSKWVKLNRVIIHYSHLFQPFLSDNYMLNDLLRTDFRRFKVTFLAKLKSCMK
jgi:hypothetical protein